MWIVDALAVAFGLFLYGVLFPLIGLVYWLKERLQRISRKGQSCSPIWR